MKTIILIHGRAWELGAVTLTRIAANDAWKWEPKQVYTFRFW